MSELLAHPWWVNLTVLIPLVAYLIWRRGGVPLTATQLLLGALFALAFGFLEGAVVVYLRAATGLLPVGAGKLSSMAGASGELYQQAQLLNGLSKSLLRIEVLREGSTMVMLGCVAVLSSARSRGRWAMFLWTFAVWDIVYYAGLWALVRWPASLRETDVLFLIPVPWLAPVWFPLAVSGLMIAAVLAARSGHQKQKMLE